MGFKRYKHCEYIVCFIISVILMLFSEQRRQQQTEDDDKYDTSDSDTLPVLYGRSGQRGLSIYPTTPQLNTQGRSMISSTPQHHSSTHKVGQ